VIFCNCDFQTVTVRIYVRMGTAPVRRHHAKTAGFLPEASGSVQMTLFCATPSRNPRKVSSDSFGTTRTVRLFPVVRTSVTSAASFRSHDIIKCLCSAFDRPTMFAAACLNHPKSDDDDNRSKPPFSVVGEREGRREFRRCDGYRSRRAFVHFGEGNSSGRRNSVFH